MFENHSLKEELRYWRTAALSVHQQPHPLIIDLFLDISDLSPKHNLMLKDELSRRQRISNDQLSYFEDDKISRKRSILLETWQLNLSHPIPLNPPELALTYKECVVFFRALFSYVRLMPAYRFAKRINRDHSPSSNNSTQGLKMGYRLSKSRLFPKDEAGLDQLHIGDDMRKGISEFSFGTIQTPFGVFSLHVTYRTECEFSVDTDTIFSSRFVDVDDNYFSQRPITQTTPPSAPSSLSFKPSSVSNRIPLSPRSQSRNRKSYDFTKHSSSDLFLTNTSSQSIPHYSIPIRTHPTSPKSVPSPSTSPAYKPMSVDAPRSIAGSIISLSERRRPSHSHPQSFSSSPYNFFMPSDSPTSQNSSLVASQTEDVEQKLITDTLDTSLRLSSAQKRTPSLRDFAITKNAVAAGRKMADSENLDVLLGSSPPFPLSSPGKSFRSVEQTASIWTSNASSTHSNTVTAAPNATPSMSTHSAIQHEDLTLASPRTIGFEFPVFATLEVTPEESVEFEAPLGRKSESSGGARISESGSMPGSMGRSSASLVESVSESFSARRSKSRAALAKFHQLKDINASFTELVVQESTRSESRQRIYGSEEGVNRISRSDSLSSRLRLMRPAS
ncbi:autophagy protein 13, partial [Nowakowskiella sp. JEL0078]